MTPVDDNSNSFSLTALIDKAIADSRQDKEYKSWRASSIGGCPRSHFYKRLGIEPTTPPNDTSLRKFECGNIFHNWIQDIASVSAVLGDGGLDYAEKEKEVFDKEMDLGGRYDLLLTTGEKRILFDIKTVHSRAFWQLEKSGKTIKDQWPQYWKQLGAYMLMLKRAGTPVDEGRILLVSKDDLVCKEVTYYLSDELEDEVFVEVNLLNKHWKDKTLPDCSCEGWKVQYCSYGVPTEGKVVECCPESLFTNYKEK